MQADPLPVYPENRKIELGDRDYIVPALEIIFPKTSDQNFTNIFAWRNAYDYNVSQLDGMIIVQGFIDTKGFFLPPIGDPAKAAKVSYNILKMAERMGVPLVLEAAQERLADEMEQMPGVTVISERDNWDYVYESVELAELPGQRYHAKRNLIKQFQDKFSAKVEDLSAKACKEAMEFSERWCEQRDCESDDALTKEKCAIYQMLTHFDELKLHGIMVRLGDEIAGLSVGEELTEDTYVVHVEKGDQHCRGIYQFINQQLAMRVAQKYKWINREPDVGVAGLRHAKTSYHPHHFMETFQISYKRG